MKRHSYLVVPAALLVGACFLCSPSSLPGQEKYPVKPITISIGQAAGGSSDIIMRALAPFVQAELKVPVIVQNNPGAGGDLHMNVLWKAKPDGYTTGTLTFPANLVRELTKKTPYKPLEMSYVYGITGGDFTALSVPMNSPVKTFADLRRAAGERSLAGGGTVLGSNSWYASVMLREATGMKFKYVPYESGTEAATAAGGGHVDFSLTSSVSAVQPAQNKLVRVIATFGEKRDADFGDAPTMVELGYKDVRFGTRVGLGGPPGLSRETIGTLANAVAKAVQDPKFKEIAKRQGFAVDPLTGAEFYKWTVETNEQARKYLTRAGEIK